MFQNFISIHLFYMCLKQMSAENIFHKMTFIFFKIKMNDFAVENQQILILIHICNGNRSLVCLFDMGTQNNVNSIRHTGCSKST